MQPKKTIKTKNTMGKEYLTLAKMAEKKMIVVDYSDEDIAIIDNVKDFTEVNPTRLHNNFIAIIKQGKAQLKANGETVTIGESQLFLCPPNTSLTDFMFSPGLEFQAILLSDNILSTFLREKKDVWNDTMYIYKRRVVTIKQQHTEFLSDISHALRILVSSENENNPYRSEGIRGLIYSIVFGLCGILSTTLPEKKKGIVRGDNIFQQFLMLLNENKINSNHVEDYASALYISPKHLSAVCKKATGKTAKAWIREHIKEEIRYYMKETDLTIKQAAYKTGFINDSFFCKYVRQHFGMTPMQLRQK